MLSAFFGIVSANVIAQSAPVDTTVMLPSVEVNAHQTRQSVVGSMSSEWQTTLLQKLPTHNLADLLQTQAGTYIKTYGLGSLATSSVRGGSAGHTLVLWNGLPVQNPMLGLLDLALLPVQSAESISFTKGGNGAMWGSGAIGGVIEMRNEADFSQKLNVTSSTEFGSFGYFKQQLKLGLGNEKLQSVTRFSFLQADNDFYYFLADGLPERQQTNARISQQFLSQDLYWKINPRNQLDFHLWWEQSDRQIPPTKVQTRSEAHQDDLITRLLLEYKYIGDAWLWRVKAGYFDEHIDYYDDLILLESPNHFQTILGEITGQWFHKKHEFLFGSTHTHTRAMSAGYRDQTPEEYKTALFASWKYTGGKWNTQISIRQEMVDGTVVPTVPSFGFDWYFAPSLILKGKVSRNYRLPTLNDRYWIPGGNPDLLPESGWSEELTIEQKSKERAFQLNVSLTAFNRKIDNWILWSIPEGQSYWSSNNITRVWSRGLEPRLAVTYKPKNIALHWRFGYDYIRSTNEVAVQHPNIAVGDQLIYTPVHQAFGAFTVDWKNLHVMYQHNFTGETEGINETIDAYHVGNVRIQYSGTLSQLKGTMFLNINNIWDADYVVIERRPMPGIYFQTGLNLFFNVNP